ncbi:MAG: hypothetical protein R3195_18670 [Gemmatimonadota bacterium]|nr:hypothetical protein [Gemmatimonadota bacterium]
MLKRSALQTLGGLIGAAAVSGCLLGLDTEPGLGLLHSVVAEGEALPESTLAAGGTSAVTVSGQIVGKLPCDEVYGEVDVDGDELRVRITVNAERQFCAGIAPTTFSYVANILNVKSGDRPIVVEYRYVGVDGANGVRLDTLVAVG